MDKVIAGLSGAAVLVAGGMVAAAPASAAPARNHYMVYGLQYIDGIYIGDFVAVRKKGRKVVGAMGEFGSEYQCLKGKVRNGRLKGWLYHNGQRDQAINVRWVGKGSKQRVKGMAAVTKAEMVQFSGGYTPTSMIRYCRANT